MEYEMFYSGPSLTRVQGKCTIRKYEHNGMTVIVAVQTKNSSGPSVTNSIENVCKAAWQNAGRPEHVMFVEHYQGTNEFELVTFGDTFIDPSWRNMPLDELELWIGKKWKEVA